MNSLLAMIDLKRFRGLPPVVATLALCIAAVNFILLAAIGPAPSHPVSRQFPLDWEGIQETESSVAGLATVCRRSPQENGSFLLYMGLSTSRAIDSKILATGCNPKVMGICGSGGSMEVMAELAEPLLRRNLHPAQLVLCVHPAWLVGHPSESAPPLLDPMEPLRSRNWGQVKQRLNWWNWLSSNSVFVDHIALNAMHATTVEMGNFPETSPWHPPRPLRYPPHQDERELAFQLSGFEHNGWFDPQQYARNGPGQGKALDDLISRFRALGSEVLIVLMPETSAYRKRVPPEARQDLQDALEQRFHGEAPPVLDFQDAIPDEMFSDYLHLNQDGTAKFSPLLAGRLRAALHSCPR